MGLHDLLALLGSAIAAIIGGVWAIGKIVYSFKVKASDLEKKMGDDRITRLEADFKLLSSLVTTVRTELEQDIKRFSGEMASIRLNMVQTSAQFEKAISAAREEFIKDVGRLSEKIASLAGVAEKLEAKYIGEGRYRVGSKNPKGE